MNDYISYFIDLGIIAFIIAAYIILYRIFTNKIADWRRPIKLWIISGSLFFALFFLINFFLEREPESYREGVELLEKDKDIIKQVGLIQSESYHKKDLPKSTDDPAHFKVELNGTIASIYISCVVRKDNVGKWQLTSVVQDSLVKK